MARWSRPKVALPARERLLAWAPDTEGGWVVGTRDALYLPLGSAALSDGSAALSGGSLDRIPWEQVQAADWDREARRLQVTEVGTWGEPRPLHVVTMPDSAARDADRLLQLVRERVTASVLLSRHIPVSGRLGVRIVARRAPSGRSEIHWAYEYDEGVDPADPDVRAAAEAALAAAKSDVGMV